ncbi:MAG TPA: FAD-dependent oxidoreductase [Phycisphaerae bacterium]|nr:FAD-dependent oxidoreductase [Phycisphaerae bacterium]
MKCEGTEVFTGSELLVKGALETEGGVHLLGGYPGSPIAGYFDSLTALKDVLREKGIRAVINNNEALAAAMLNGTQSLPLRSMIAMKSVGVHVAADALALANLAGANPEGGAIVIYGDDPWSDSTQVASDSRYISKHLFIPTIEPSNPQEIKDFVNLSFKLSAISELVVGYIITTNLADGGGTVECRPNHFPSVNMYDRIEMVTKDIDFDKRVLLPPRTWWQEASLTGRFSRAMKAARELGLNRFEYRNETSVRKPLGFVCAGLGHDYLTQALYEMGQLGQAPILKLGLSYPVDPEMIEDLARQVERIIVVEERRGFMEEQIAEIMTALRQKDAAFDDVMIFGKKFPDGLKGLPEIRGLDPSIIIQTLGPLVCRYCTTADSMAASTIQTEIRTIEQTESVKVTTKLPARLPTFCPGCPHRDSANLCTDIKRCFADPDYMRQKHHREPVDLIFHGDIGCYTMLMFPPNNELMHDLSGMGLGGGTGSGIDPFTTNNKVTFMGDSTFFHIGMTSISQAIKFNQNITYIILDNSTTAMTGHQPTPGVDYDVLGNRTPAQDIENVVRGLVGSLEIPVIRMNPARRGEYRELLERTFLMPGVKIIIADKECGITRTRRLRRFERDVIKSKGFLPAREHMNINQEICRFCLACTKLTGCPGLKHVQTDYGVKMDTDLSNCVADGACERIGECDAFERVVVKRKAQPRSRVPELDLDNIPEPRKRPTEDVWRCCLTGVGGMGIGLATSILVRAGHNEGYRVIFMDRKGMAIRNGGVFSQVTFNLTQQPVTAVIPHGKADLLIGVDVLEAARILDPKNRVRVISKDKTAAVINMDKVQTIAGIMGREDFDTDELVRLIQANTRGDEFLARNISRICEKYLGSRLYANVMMLGYAFQQGLIPVSMHSMAWAIKDTIRVDFKKNLYAFNMGRKLVDSPDLFQGPHKRTTWRETLDDKARELQRRFGKNAQAVAEFRDMLVSLLEKLREFNQTILRDIVIRAYDCVRWGGVDYCRQYVNLVRNICEKDRPEYGYAASGAVVKNLAQAMLIKDAVFKAELSTSHEKYRRDAEKYNVNPANGDRIIYRHLWKRHIKIGSWEKQIRFSVYDWQLKILRRMRFIRSVTRFFMPQEYGFREEYINLTSRFAFGDAEEYRRQVRLLSGPLCQNCYMPSCSQQGCPLGNDVPKWISLAREGKWKVAYAKLAEKNNFPEFTAGICPAFCEQNCHQGIGGYSVQVREMEREIIDRAFEQGWVQPFKPRGATGKNIAVIGSGPAGLAAAQQLCRTGHTVTVFEKNDAAGGMLRVGVPAARLAKQLIDRRIEQLRQEGVQFMYGVEVGRDVSGESLLHDFDVVCLACGAIVPRELDLPGRAAANIHFALDYLGSQNRADVEKSQPSISASGKTVVVIGGGLTGEDCVETAMRQGAKEVYQLEILPQDMTAVLDENPAVKRMWQVRATEFTSQSGSVTGVKALRVEYRPTAKGPVMEKVDGSEFSIAADIVIIAAGFLPQIPSNLAKDLKIQTDNRGSVIIPGKYTTTNSRVFIAGDLATGSAYVATAIDSGRKAARAISSTLRRKTI